MLKSNKKQILKLKKEINKKDSLIIEYNANVTDYKCYSQQILEFQKNIIKN